MAYIGNGRTLLVLGSNVRDDITPGYNAGTISGPFDKTTFTLSQEVPGGYEGNVYVFRQKYLIEKLVANTDLVSIVSLSSTQFKISTSNASLAAALSDIRESLKTYAEQNHTLTIAGETKTANNGTFSIVSCSYDGASIDIVLTKTNATQGGDGVDYTTPRTPTSLTVSHGYSGFWEVLEPEIDYTIDGAGTDINKLITFTSAPQFNDKIYVIHKGDATYNLVPSDNSVGPQQLSSNLRNFVNDVAAGDGSTVSFTLSQDSVSENAIIVTVNGVVQDGEIYNGSSVSLSKDYALNVSVSPNTVIFRTAPSNTAKVRILHLGFSTVSRRQTLSPGQGGSVADGSITTPKLANSSVVESKIASGAVTNSILAANSVTSDKIRLANNTALRTLQANGSTIVDAIYTGTDDVTHINAPVQTSLAIAGVKKYNFTGTALTPETTAQIALGTPSKKFTDLHLSGTANMVDLTATGAASVTGNITVGGTVDGVDISAFESSVNTSITNLTNLIETLVPIGTMTIWTQATASATLVNNRWLVCDGAAVSRSTYSALFAAIGSTFGSGNGTTTFNLPDMRRRVAVGRGDSDSIGNSDGLALASRLLEHDHTVPAHTHGLASHTHNVPAHYHSMGNGATLNIGQSFGTTTDKGGHTTTIDISHGHSAASGTLATDKTTLYTDGSKTGLSILDYGHTHDWDTAINTYHSNANGRTAYVSETGLTYTHQHTGTADSAGAHEHSIIVEGGTSSGGRVAWSNSGAPSSTKTGQIPSAGAHTHSLTINATNTNHYHLVKSAKTGISLSTEANHGHTILTSTTISGYTFANGEHAHTFTVPALGTTNKSDSNGGIHSHSASNFAGSIGHVNSGNNGDSATFNTLGPSVGSTDNSVVLTSGTKMNVPYMITNYIIRAL